MTTEEELRESNKHLFNGFIEVLKAYMEGKPIQYISKHESGKGEWKDIGNDCFNAFDLGEYFYRVKPETEISPLLKLYYYPMPWKYEKIEFDYDTIGATRDLKFEDSIKTRIDDYMTNEMPEFATTTNFIQDISGIFKDFNFMDLCIQPEGNTFSIGFYNKAKEIEMNIYFNLVKDENFIFKYYRED